MGCCSVTQRHTGIDEVGPDEIELLELSRKNLGLFRQWNLEDTRLQLSLRNNKDEPPPRCPSTQHLEQEEVVLWGRSIEELHHRIYSQPIRDWEGQPAHMYGEITHSSLAMLFNRCTQETSEHFLVLFSYHLLILTVNHFLHDFIYEGILPLSAISFQALSLEPGPSHIQHMFEISGQMVDSKVFICTSAAELSKWILHLEKRRFKSTSQPLSPPYSHLSYLLPLDEHWKREELKLYLLKAPIWNWEGSPIQHMGKPGYLSMVHILNAKREGVLERLMMLFPQDVLLLSVDNKHLNIRYEGRLPRKSIQAVERSVLPGQLEFELIGDMVEPMNVSCFSPQDYQNWIFHLKQPEKNSQDFVSHIGPPIMPKCQRNKQESQEPMINAEQYHTNGWT